MLWSELGVGEEDVGVSIPLFARSFRDMDEDDLLEMVDEMDETRLDFCEAVRDRRSVEVVVEGVGDVGFEDLDKGVLREELRVSTERFLDEEAEEAEEETVVAFLNIEGSVNRRASLPDPEEVERVPVARPP